MLLFFQQLKICYYGIPHGLWTIYRANSSDSQLQDGAPADPGEAVAIFASKHRISSIQWEFQDPKMEALYHIKPYFVVIFHYIGLIYGRYLHFRILKFPLIYGFYLFFSAMSDPIRDVPGSKGEKTCLAPKNISPLDYHRSIFSLYHTNFKNIVYLGYFYIVIPSISQNMPKYIHIYIYICDYICKIVITWRFPSGVPPNHPNFHNLNRLW